MLGVYRFPRLDCCLYPKGSLSPGSYGAAQYVKPLNRTLECKSGYRISRDHPAL